MKVNLEKGYNGFMRYHDITKDDMLNGDGLRVVLWVDKTHPESVFFVLCKSIL